MADIVAAILACVAGFSNLPVPSDIPLYKYDPEILEAQGIWGQYHDQWLPVVRIRYSPEGHWGRVILAHELTHHVQKRAGVDHHNEDQAWQAGYACAEAGSSE